MFLATFCVSSCDHTAILVCTLGQKSAPDTDIIFTFFNNNPTCHHTHHLRHKCLVFIHKVTESDFLSQSAGSFWDPQSSQTLVLGTPSSPVTKMVPVGGKLWCGSQNRVLIINTTTLVQEVGGQMDGDGCVCGWVDK